MVDVFFSNFFSTRREELHHNGYLVKCAPARHCTVRETIAHQSDGFVSNLTCSRMKARVTRSECRLGRFYFEHFTADLDSNDD